MLAAFRLQRFIRQRPNGVHMADSLQEGAMSAGRHRARHTGPPEPARHPATRGRTGEADTSAPVPAYGCVLR